MEAASGGGLKWGDGDPERSAARRLLERVLTGEKAVSTAGAAQAVALAGLARVWPCPHHPDEVADLDTGELGLHEGEAFGGVCADVVSEVVSQVAADLHLTCQAAETRVRHALHLTSHLPLTLAAWQAGVLDGRRVAIIAEETRFLTGQRAADVDERVCGEGPQALAATAVMTTGLLTVRVREVVADVDAAAVRERSRRAVAARGVFAEDLPEGIAQLTVRGPAPAVEEIRACVGALGAASHQAAREANRAGAPSADPWADPTVEGERDRRGADAHRFDALHEYLTTLAEHQTSEGETTRSNRWTNTGPAVLVGIGTLLGCDEAPARLDGYGLIPGWMGRVVAGQRRLRRFMTDPFTGQLSAIDSTTYAPGHLADIRVEHPEGDGPDESHGPDGPDGPGEPDGGNGPDGGGGGGVSDPESGPGEGRGQQESVAVDDPGVQPDPEDLQDSDPGVGPHPDPNVNPEEPEIPAQVPEPEPEPGPGPGPEGVEDLNPEQSEPGEPGEPAQAAGQGPSLAAHPAFAATSQAAATPTCRPRSPWECPACPTPAHPGRAAHDPSAPLGRWVRRHWAHCTHPGCRRGAGSCDLDHTLPWPSGPTCSCNLAPLCRTHHLRKHGTPQRRYADPHVWAARAGTLPWRWALYRCDQGHQHWRTPLGTEHVVAPEPVLHAPDAHASRRTAERPTRPVPLSPLHYPPSIPALFRAVRGDPTPAPEAPPPPSPWPGLPDTPPF